MYEDETPENIKSKILNAITTDINKMEGSYTDSLVGPAALELSKVYDGLNAVIPIAFIDEMSGEYIDKRCAEIGITRKPGTKATAVLSFKGNDGTVIPSGTVFLTLDGLEYVTQVDVTITSGTASSAVIAVNVGEIYNVPAGSIVNQYNSIAGLSTVTNTAAATGGTDPETDKSLVKRYYAYLQNPATSGNVHHYEQWALEVNGVGAVRVTPLENGPGTVGVLIAGPEKQPVSAEAVAACAEHIEASRPIGASVTVKSATGLTINVSAAVTVESSTTKEAVKTALSNALNEYLKSLAFEKYTVIYNHIAYLLLGINGVSDYTSLTVNGGTGNIMIAKSEVPIMGTVTIT